MKNAEPVLALSRGRSAILLPVGAALLLLFAAALVQAGEQQAVGLDARIAEIAAKLASLPTVTSGSTIAVFPFSEKQSGAPDSFGLQLSSRLTAHLSAAGKFGVITQDQIAKRLDAYQVRPGGTDDQAARTAGRVVAARIAVTGVYSLLDAQVRLSVRVLPVSGGPGSTIETAIARTAEVNRLLGQAPAGPEARKTASPKKASKAAVVVPVSLGDASFTPVTGILPPKYRGCTVVLSDRKPEGILREPDYRGAVRRYGKLKLGTTKNTQFLFALDITPGKYAALYIDRNQSGDLTREALIKNQGKDNAYFSGDLTLPFSSIMDSVNFSEYHGEFHLDAVSWGRNRICYWSTTQLKGEVMIEGRPYFVSIGDSAENDADYTNDGLYIDLNRNNQIDPKTEYVPPGGVVAINGKNYSFSISRETGSRRVLFQDPDVKPGDPARILKVTLVAETDQSLLFDVDYYLSETFPGSAMVAVYPDLPYQIVEATRAYPGRHTVSIKVAPHFEAKGKREAMKSSTLRFQIEEYRDYAYQGDLYRRIVPFEKQWKKQVSADSGHRQ